MLWHKLKYIYDTGMSHSEIGSNEQTQEGDADFCIYNEATGGFGGKSWIIKCNSRNFFNTLQIIFGLAFLCTDSSGLMQNII